MRSLLLFPALLTACATVPPELEAAKASVDGRLEYVYYKGWKRPAYLKPSQGNCTTFASHYHVASNNAGHGGKITTCRLPDGQGHAVFDTYSGYRLDNRERWVVKISESACK